MEKYWKCGGTNYNELITNSLTPETQIKPDKAGPCKNVVTGLAASYSRTARNLGAVVPWNAPVQLTSYEDRTISATMSPKPFLAASQSHSESPDKIHKKLESLPPMDIS